MHPSAVFAPRTSPPIPFPNTLLTQSRKTSQFAIFFLSTSHTVYGPHLLNPVHTYFVLGRSGSPGPRPPPAATAVPASHRSPQPSLMTRTTTKSTIYSQINVQPFYLRRNLTPLLRRPPHPRPLTDPIRLSIDHAYNVVYAIPRSPASRRECSVFSHNL